MRRNVRTQRLGRSTKPRFASGSLTTSRAMPLLLCSFDGLGAGVALIDMGQGHALALRLLDGLGDAADLGAVIDIGEVTWSASRWPSVSTARCNLEPRSRLAPS